ncbi:unnamed protein product [Parascedosporium putredinis]|uniref:Nephrocystin 3-like N-terminal domain-containing protein n=1 Tax=Parascedosporium putredinis TaxID=1442378 RepID=A0A9P1MAX1_9PEZI|nr:unnamed protein product [Parascedosporium putredinis]CAI7994894.1 unnamed protein product [Parascedosporium putredinis]
MFKFTDASPFRVFTTSTDRPCAVLEQYPDNLFVLTFHRAAHRRYAFVKPSVYVSSRSLAIPILGVDISPVPEQMPGNGFVAPVDSAVQRAPVVTKDESRRAPRSRRNLTTASCPSVLTDPVLDREQLRTAHGQRTAGTCEWILENVAYKSWLREGECLGIAGGPGKGKTMLSIFLSEEL